MNDNDDDLYFFDDDCPVDSEVLRDIENTYWFDGKMIEIDDNGIIMEL